VNSPELDQSAMQAIVEDPLKRVRLKHGA